MKSIVPRNHTTNKSWSWRNSSWAISKLKDDTVKVLHSMRKQIWETQQWSKDWKVQFSFQSQRKGMPKNVQTTAQLHTFHMLARWYSKSFHPGFNNMWTKDFQMYKLDLEKAEEQISNCQHLLDHRKSRGARKTSTSASLTKLKPLTVWITTNCGKFLKRWECQTTLPNSQETCMQVKKQELGWEMEQQTSFKLRKE